MHPNLLWRSQVIFRLCRYLEREYTSWSNSFASSLSISSRLRCPRLSPGPICIGFTGDLQLFDTEFFTTSRSRLPSLCLSKLNFRSVGHAFFLEYSKVLPVLHIPHSCSPMLWQNSRLFFSSLSNCFIIILDVCNRRKAKFCIWRRFIQEINSSDANSSTFNSRRNSPLVSSHVLSHRTIISSLSHCTDKMGAVLCSTSLSLPLEALRCSASPGTAP